MPRTSTKTKTKVKQQNNTKQQSNTKQKTKARPKTRTLPKPIDWTLSTPIERDSAVGIRERLTKIAALMNRGLDFNTAKRIVAY